MMNPDLKIIKDTYGEKMTHLCRELLPTALEIPGLLPKVLEDNLAPSRTFADDIDSDALKDSFVKWIYGLTRIWDNDYTDTDKTPFEIFDELGYTLYKCETVEDIESFRKYYSDKEVICSISKDAEDRIKNYYTFFVVRKDVDQIKREDFNKPYREDKYGTSVMSIRFSKTPPNYATIVCRYNHTVDGPNGTFQNNLEKIAPGLTKSFEKYYGLEISPASFVDVSNSKGFFLEDCLPYVKAADGRYYRYNINILYQLEKNCNIYVCENNIIINGKEVYDGFAKNKERYIVFDQYVIDLMEKRIFLASEVFLKDESNKDVKDKYAQSFIDSIYDVGPINKIEVKKANNDCRVIFIYYDDGKTVIIALDKHNDIIGYENDYVEEIKDHFLEDSKSIRWISIANAKRIGDGFNYYGNVLESLYAPNVIDIGETFLNCNMGMKSLYLPNVTETGDFFMSNGDGLEEFVAPELLRMGICSFSHNTTLTRLYAPNLIDLGNSVLFRNKNIDVDGLYQEVSERSGKLANRVG